jgi:hypothetical protein
LEVARPITPGERLLNAYEVLKSDPSRLGDVLADLNGLPAAEANSEFVLRIKLFIYGQVDYRDDYQAVLDQLERRASG